MLYVKVNKSGVGLWLWFRLHRLQIIAYRFLVILILALVLGV